jgi:phosphonate transport system substrate-binding protein
MPTRLLFFLLLSCFYINEIYADTPNPASLKISVVPQLSPIAIHKAWIPILEKLSAETGLKFELIVENSIPSFEHSLTEGVPDIAFMNPYHMILAKRTQAYTPLIRDSANLLTGIIVVRKDSKISSLEDLQSKHMTFPAPNAFAASLLVRAILAQRHITIYPEYIKTHSNVYRSVLLNDADAGGGVNNTYDREPNDVREQLRILFVTPESAPHPLAVHPRLAETLRQQIYVAFIKLAGDPLNAELFDAIQIPKPIAADYARDYLPLEALELDRYAIFGSD